MEYENTEYAMAVAAHDDACKTYRKVQEAYHSMQIGDAEFLAARKVYDAATMVFDAAFAKESA